MIYFAFSLALTYPKRQTDAQVNGRRWVSFLSYYLLRISKK